MMHVISRLAGPIAFAFLLTGCSSDAEDAGLTDGPKQVIAQVQQAIKVRREGPPPKLELTAAQRAEFDRPVLQVNSEQFGGSDFLGLTTTRTDSGIGEVKVWNSAQKLRIYLRNGVVIGSRGIGSDIISADANVTIKALASRAQAQGVRTYISSDGDITTTKYTFRCTIENRGNEVISIGEQPFRTTKMVETCVDGPEGIATLHNEYWVQNPGRLVRKSRQWLGPRIGYFEILLVKN